MSVESLVRETCESHLMNANARLQAAVHLERMKARPITGTFGKALDGAISINFSLSGSANCDRACRHHPDSTAPDPTHACYAVRSEIRPDRSQLMAKLARHGQMKPALVVNRAIFEIQQALSRGKSIPWVRISTNGSLPQPADVRDDRGFRDAFRRLLEVCRDNGIPIHIPVETYAKARFYRALAGSLAVIRESAQTSGRFIRAKGAVSGVAGTRDQTRIERVEAARQLAKARAASTGRKCVVCPAVLNSFAARRDPSKKNPRAKCGACVACALSTVDVVYPLH